MSPKCPLPLDRLLYVLMIVLIIHLSTFIEFYRNQQACGPILMQPVVSKNR